MTQTVWRSLQHLPLTTNRLHCYHVLGASQWKLNHLEQGVTHAFAGSDTGRERQEENVPPRDEESHGPGPEPENEEPQDPPQYSRAAPSSPFPLTLAHIVSDRGTRTTGRLNLYYLERRTNKLTAVSKCSTALKTLDSKSFFYNKILCSYNGKGVL